MDVAMGWSLVPQISSMAEEESVADVAFMPVGVTQERFSAMDFTSVFAFYPTVFLIKAPDKVIDWNSVTKPFTLNVWIAIFSIVLIFGLTLYKVLEKDFVAAKTGKRWTLRTVFWNLVCTLLGEGLNLSKVKRFASRFVLGIWLLSILVLLSGYSGALMSFMTCPLTESYPRDIQELADFVRNGEYSCGTYKEFLLWKEMMAQNERFAYIMTKRTLNRYISKIEKHKYVMSKDSFRTYIMAYPIRKNFPFKKDLTNTVTRMFEAGIFEKLYFQEVEEFQDESEFQPLSIEDIKSPLLLMGVGYVVSLIFLIIEIILTKVIKIVTCNPLY
ncbi:ionotropic receptor 93a-like [Centruroides sculpturatus]|uniref:ionotropic receptor 93a-like n=1 Tax=Centruroides sculpturatus TaxID=218467 RepID=UPI000C6E1D6E|nr:ionotropic receptor 93a-like [Centruroides sculpturatus]